MYDTGGVQDAVHDDAGVVDVRLGVLVTKSNNFALRAVDVGFKAEPSFLMQIVCLLPK